MRFTSTVSKENTSMKPHFPLTLTDILVIPTFSVTDY